MNKIENILLNIKDEPKFVEATTSDKDKRIIKNGVIRLNGIAYECSWPHNKKVDIAYTIDGRVAAIDKTNQTGIMLGDV